MADPIENAGTPARANEKWSERKKWPCSGSASGATPARARPSLAAWAFCSASVFALTGLGRLTVDAVLQRDYAIIQGVTLLFAFVYALVNLAVDLSYTLFDPRIRY